MEFKLNNGPNHQPLAIAGPLGEDVHVGGVSHFLRLAEEAGYRTLFLGPAVSLPDFIAAIHAERPELVGVSYRLTPETGESLLRLFVREVRNRRLDSPSYWFAGTPPTAAVAERLDFFDRVFDGTQRSDEVLSMLRGQSMEVTEDRYPQTAVERIAWKHPYPILRHHFGQPTVEATVEGVRRIADARVLDVVSLGTDQDAQANFFHPERQEGRRAGAGGVPVRSEEDFVRLYEATRTGNHPLMRVYSGTDDFLRLADMYVRTMHNAWCAIPLFWFNDMDGRGPWPLEESIRLHQEVMAWYARRGIPVEINEPHHWGMRDAPDSVCVASAYLSALNAKRFGVNDYFAQYMFNSPAELSDAMDLAKMLACAELAESLAGDDFLVIVGEEVTTRGGDIIGLFLREPVTSSDPLEAVAQIHDQGGVALLPHPFSKTLGVDERVARELDACEGYNHRYSTGEGPSEATPFALEYNLAMTGASDAHRYRDIGRGRTVVAAETPEEVRAALREGRTTVTVDRPGAGARVGWALVDALAWVVDPVPERLLYRHEEARG